MPYCGRSTIQSAINMASVAFGYRGHVVSMGRAASSARKAPTLDGLEIWADPRY